MKSKFENSQKTPRRLWLWSKRIRKQNPKAKPLAPFFKRKLPPTHRS